MLISDEGYHFESTTDSSGAFIPLSEANNYHVSNLSEGDNVTMVFNEYGRHLRSKWSINKLVIY